MPHLEELEIRQCYDLKSIESLHHIKTLKEINLIEVNENLEIRGGTDSQTLVKSVPRKHQAPAVH